MIGVPNRLFSSSGKRAGGLFEPSTIEVRWRIDSCDVEEASTLREEILSDFNTGHYLIRIGTEFRAVDGTAPEWAAAADRVTLEPFRAYETVAYEIRPVPESNKIWEVSARLQLLEAIPSRGHALVKKNIRSRVAQAWRANPFEAGCPDSTLFEPTPAENSSKALPCSLVGGDRVDINGQPMSVVIDQHVITASFVVRAPYVNPLTGIVTTTTAWDFWTSGAGSKMIGNRNNTSFWGWPAYSLVMEGIDVAPIGNTTFNRIDVTMVHDEWWHLEQAPVTYRGALPPTVDVCGGKVFQTEDTLWVNPYIVYSDFNTMIPHIPIDSRTYLQLAAGLTGAVPSCD